MSTDIARFDPNEGQLKLLRDTLAAGTSDDEFDLFIEVCRRTRLDPFQGQIHAVMRWDGRLKRMAMTIQTGIGGYRVIGNRTGAFAGTEGPFWCGEDGEWRDVWIPKAPPVASKVVIWRAGIDRGFSAVAHLIEYLATTKEGAVTQVWQTRPRGQLAKCAESLAWRMGFASDMGAIYTDEEMAHVDNPVRELGADRVREASRLAAQRITTQALPAATIATFAEPVIGDEEPDEFYEPDDLDEQVLFVAPANPLGHTEGIIEPSSEQLAEWTPNDWIALAKLAGRKLTDPEMRAAGLKSWRDPANMTTDQRSNLWRVITQPTETGEA